MTRALSQKAGAALLRKTFLNKGVNLSNTEALDLIAQLQGYNAWSHMQQATKAGPPPVVAPAATQTAVPASAKPGCIPMLKVFQDHYGPDGSCPAYPRHSWPDVRQGETYYEWVLRRISEDDRWNGPTEYVPQCVSVTRPDGTPATWHVEQNLSTREGEINDAHADEKPGLSLLMMDTPLYERLCAQMWDETTFIVRKDGEFGLLFEAEYLSQESDATDEDVAKYKPRDQVIAFLAEQLVQLEKQYPQVQFCVPDPTHIFYERPAVWGFYKLDALTLEEREALGLKLISL